MRKLLLILIPFAILSCTKKEIKIPTLPEKGIQELHNHSQIWLFFEIKNGDTIAKVNSNNTITSTHWIFNIDKRLPLKTIIAPVKKLIHKHANAMHSKKGAYNYFSYADTISKKLSFLKLNNLQYKTDSILSTNFIRTNSNLYKKYNNINLIFSSNTIWLNGTKIEKEDFKTTVLEFIAFSSEEKQTMLHLNFNQNILYQDYLFYKTTIYSLQSDFIVTNPIEFIFNQNKVPDCNC